MHVSRTSCARPASRRSTHCRLGRYRIRPGSGVRRPMTSASPGHADRGRSPTSRVARPGRGGGSAARSTGRGRRSSHARRATRTESRSPGRARTARFASCGTRNSRLRSGVPQRSSPPSASQQAIASASSCRCSPKRSSRFSRSAASGRSSRRSSRATGHPPSRRASPIATPGCSSRPMGSCGEAAGST